MQLALGDALAIALLEKRKFSSADFKNFHPGGKLGASLSRIADIMHQGDALPLASRVHCAVRILHTAHTALYMYIYI